MQTHRSAVMERISPQCRHTDQRLWRGSAHSADTQISGYGEDQPTVQTHRSAVMERISPQCRHTDQRLWRGSAHSADTQISGYGEDQPTVQTHRSAVMERISPQRGGGLVRDDRRTSVTVSVVDENDVVIVHEGIGRGVGVAVEDVGLGAAVVADVDHAPDLCAGLRELRWPALGLACRRRPFR